VVVKVLSPELAAGVSAERFAREVRLAASLQQANIVPVLAAGAADGLPFYTMPFVEGQSLRARLQRDGALPIAEAVSILKDVARALAYAHARGVVHRDIKPENVLLSGGVGVVTDFGIAKAITAARTDGDRPAPTLTQVGMSVGTPAYMAPEQAAADPAVDHRADIYALGIVAYEMLTGAPPFTGGSSQALVAAHLVEAPTPVTSRRPDVPPELAALARTAAEGGPIAAFAASRSGLGTNGVALRPPDAMRLRFGEPSFDNHLAAARALGLAPRVVSLPGLALDIDAPDDIAALLERPASTETQRLLSGWRLPERLAAAGAVRSS
jgi:serine/threonine-protein kinase